MWEILNINSVDTELLDRAFKCGWEPFSVTTMNNSYDTNFIWLRRKKV